MGFFPSQRSGEEPGIYSRMVGQRFRTRMLPVFQSECTAWKAIWVSISTVKSVLSLKLRAEGS
jgi:hypothetical protein